METEAQEELAAYRNGWQEGYDRGKHSNLGPDCVGYLLDSAEMARLHKLGYRNGFISGRHARSRQRRRDSNALKQQVSDLMSEKRLARMGATK